MLYTPAPEEDMPQSAGLNILANEPGLQYDSGWKILGASMIATDTKFKMAFNFTGASQYCPSYNEVMNIYFITYLRTLR